MEKKLFAFDLDGTLLSPDKGILAENIEALRVAKDKGHILSVATGRNYHLSEKTIAMVEDLVDYYICTNGVVLKEFVGNKEFKTYGHLSSESILKVVDLIKDYPVIYSLATDDELYISHYLPKDELFKSNENWKMAFEKFINVDHYTEWDKLIEATKTSGILQFSLWTEPKDNMEITNMIKELGLPEETFSSSMTSIDVVPNGINKWTTLSKLADSLNIENKNVIAFGDSGNDIDMLEGAGLSFAMENASDEAKAAANKIIGNNKIPSIAEEVMKLI